jgi:hypothetical protein
MSTFSNWPPPPPPLPTTDYSPQYWQEFSFPAGGFAIKMPGEPIQTEGTLESKGHELPVTIYRYFGKTSSITHSVSYTDFPYNLESPHIVKQLFDEMRDAVVKKADGMATYNVLGETDVSLDGHPGRLLEVEVDHKAILRSKSFAVGNRLYQVTVITMSLGALSREMRRLHEEVALRFLDSFKLIQDAERELFIQ